MLKIESESRKGAVRLYDCTTAPNILWKVPAAQPVGVREVWYTAMCGAALPCHDHLTEDRLLTQDSPHSALSLEPYVSVDVETAGPNPSQYSLLSIGACLVSRPAVTFYVELQPLTPDTVPSALAVHGLSLERLSREGLGPREAMQRLADWLAASLAGVQPVFVGFNAPFDWMFVNDYFHRFLGHNPFGHSALDIKAFYMGLHAVPWS